jgi:hypothetical protein
MDAEITRRIEAAVQMKVIPGRCREKLIAIVRNTQIKGSHPVEHPQMFSQLEQICGLQMLGDPWQFTGVKLLPLTLIQSACFEVSKLVTSTDLYDVIKTWTGLTKGPISIHDVDPTIRLCLAQFGIHVVNGNFATCTEDELCALRQYAETIQDVMFRALIYGDIDRIIAVNITMQELANNVAIILGRTLCDPVLIRILPRVARKVVKYDKLTSIEL